MEAIQYYGDGICLEAIEEAFAYGRPEIFNTDQGVQFTCRDFTSFLESAGIRISMDGKGRWMDNVFIERLWRSVKYELTYLKEYETCSQIYLDIKDYFDYYNNTRPHQKFDLQPPNLVYNGLLWLNRSN